MKHTFRHYSGMVMAALLLSGCAPKSYVALLENTDGSVGEVMVNSGGNTTLINQPRLGANLDGSSAQAYAVSAEQIEQDFGKAMQAQPALPISYLLYFETQGMQLTPDSMALLPKIKETILSRQAVDISIIGHSDTMGAADMNEKLAYKRAEFVKDFFDQQALKIKEISLTSHGERNQLVKTEDNVKEPRNRRVEVTVR